MNILGISALDNVSSAGLVCDGRIVAAVSEERKTRVKLQNGFPARAIQEVLRIGGLSERDIDVIAYPFYPWRTEARHIWFNLGRNVLEELRGPTDVRARSRHLFRHAKWCMESTRFHIKYGRELDRELRKRGWQYKLERVEHHQAHAAAAYLTSGQEEALIVTLDWYGGGLAGSISLGRPDGISRLQNFRYPHSLGLFYAYVTAGLGFKPARHEGKIVGLAAHGDPDILYDEVKARFNLANGDMRLHSGMDFEFVRRLAATHRREDVAAAYQKVLEDVVQEVVAHHVRTTGMTRVVLAGGVAANVKMNQRVFEIEGVEHVFIHPAMGDDGTGTGAALDAAFRRGEARPYAIGDVYFGPEFSTLEQERAMIAGGLTPRKSEDIAAETARLISEGKVVAHFHGRMEYGPRALGHRSILYHARDPSVNDWLNKRLKRTEFMPFAPATLAEEAHRFYHNLEGAEHAARFMTITFDCTDEMKARCPAAVHIDGTARPQLVDEVHTPRFHAILKAYEALTGESSVINTSFNMHEEPIVCTPEDAVRAFVQGGLDVLVMGDYVATQADTRSVERLEKGSRAGQPKKAGARAA